MHGAYVALLQPCRGRIDEYPYQPRRRSQRSVTSARSGLPTSSNSSANA